MPRLRSSCVNEGVGGWIAARSCPWRLAQRRPDGVTSHAPEEHRALFWRIETPDNATGIVFGYARTAASVLPILSATAFA